MSTEKIVVSLTELCRALPCTRLGDYVSQTLYSGTPMVDLLNQTCNAI